MAQLKNTVSLLDTCDNEYFQHVIENLPLFTFIVVKHFRWTAMLWLRISITAQLQPK